MIKEVFNIDKFNIYSDEDNYYFFRSLEEVDIESIKNRTITNENNEIVRLITDREFYGETKYKKDDRLSLEQIVEHVKMHYNKHTNCISFSSNTNVILDYGRNTYSDRYVMIKVPKNEFGISVVNAGLYMLEEISKRLDEYYSNLTSFDDGIIKYYFDFIDNARNNEQLEKVKDFIIGKQEEYGEEIFENGVDKLTTSGDYRSLNSYQNFIKNKIILKLNLLKEPIIDNISNDFLIQVVGNAFSSLEVVYYNDVEKDIKELNPEVIDILSLVQQLPKTYQTEELKKELIDKINNNSLEINSFDLENYNINNFENNLTLQKIYDLTKGNITYEDARNIYTKAYTLAKSRLRKEKSIELLKRNIDNDKYSSLLEKLEKDTYAVEYGITDRVSNSNSINISEAVNLSISDKERFILDYINKQDINKIEDILNNPFEELQDLIEDNYTDKYIEENWFANSIIDLIDWNYYGIVDNLSNGQRELLIEGLIKNNFLEKYYKLKDKNLSDKEISNAIILQLIRNTDEIDIKEKFSLGELEEFLGCNKIKNTGINLKTYQREAFTNINKAFDVSNYTSVILPTGTGKSYVALSEMHYFEEEFKKLEENKHAKILYLAPNNYILEQLQRIIVKNYRDNFKDSDKDIIKKVFPNLTLTTYSYLNAGTNAESIVNDKYDLIIFDELHRTGAEEWGKQVDKLLEDQPAKILGITATPERDVDGKDMSEIFAKKYGYTDEDILSQKHLSYNMNIIDAIQRCIIHNPNVINCEYSLVKDGSLEDLELRIDDILDNNIRSEVKKEYEELRSQISGADGIEKILKDNLKEDGKYIVFIPITRNSRGKYINTETNDEMTLSQAQCMIKQYQDLMNQFLFSGQYLSNNKEQLFSIYEKINNNINLSNNEIEYLENEKDNIGLLVRLHINSLPNELQTLSNDMALKISEYMNWDILEDTQIISKLKKKMKNEVNSYNMISDNSKKQNDIALSNFNSDNSPKKKFMFVMDMLNEGVHVNKIDGIIWFRPLNENSRILYLQQLGRCITAIGEDNIDDIPTIIDLVNNTLKVDILKGIEKETEDLKEIVNVCRWIENNKIPDINSGIKEERENAYIIKRLQREYDKYLDTEKLESQKVERKVIIEKILEVGSKYDLWNYEFIIENPVEKTNTTSDKKDLLTVFNIKGVLRKFVDLADVVDENNIIDFEYYYNILKQLKEEGKPTNLSSIDKIKKNVDGMLSIVKKGDSDYNSPDLINVGRYLYEYQDKFSITERKKLEDVGYKFTKGTIQKLDFEDCCNILKQLKEEGQTTILGKGHKVRKNKDGTLSIIKENDSDYNSKNLLSVGSYLHRHKSDFTEGQIKLLEDIGYIFPQDKVKKLNFEDCYNILKQLKEEGKPTNLVRRDKIRINEDGTLSIVKEKDSDYHSPDLIGVGSYLYEYQDEFSKTQRKKLEDVGYKFTGDKQLNFEKYYNILKQLKEEGKPTNLARRDRIRKNEDGTLSIIKENDSDYNSKNLLSVGSYLHRHKSDFTEGQIKLLEDIGYIFPQDKVKKLNFEDCYNILKQLKEEGKPTNLVRRDKIRINEDGTLSIVKEKDSDYHSPDLIGVGIHLNRNQDKYKNNEGQRKKLEDVGYIFSTDKMKKLNFEKCYNILKQLKEEGKPTNLAGKDKIRINEDGTLSIVKEKDSDYHSPNLIGVGSYLYEYQDKFSAAQRKKLEDVGYKFTEDKKLNFEKCYNILKQLKEDGKPTNLAGKDKIRINEDGTLSVVKEKDSDYHSPDLIGVGKYLYRNQDKFNEGQMKRLKEVGYIFKKCRQKKFDQSKKEFDEERHDKVVNKVISNKEKSNEREIHELN